MSLEEAIKKTQQFYAASKRYAVSRSDADPAAYKSLGYGGPNGAAKRALGTLLSFALLEKLPGNDDSRVRISNVGYSIISLKEDDPERVQWIAASARTPKIYQEMLKEFHEGLPASDTPIHSFLAKKGYTLEGIPDLIRDFRATVAFAKLFDGGKIEEPDDDGGDDPSEAVRLAEQARLAEEARKKALMEATLTPPVPPGMEDIPIILGLDRRIILRVPDDLTWRDIEDFDESWPTAKRRIMRDLAIKATRDNFPMPPPEFRKGSATWKNRDHDEPVTVTGYAGLFENEHWVTIEGSKTGIRLAEITYDEE